MKRIGHARVLLTPGLRVQVEGVHAPQCKRQPHMAIVDGAQIMLHPRRCVRRDYYTARSTEELDAGMRKELVVVVRAQVEAEAVGRRRHRAGRKARTTDGRRALARNA